MGSTKENSLADLVHANAVGRNTCRITVATAKGKGTFHMEDGEIVDASYGDLVGEPAFYALVNAADPGFSANSGMKAPARRINTGLQTLMLNAMTLRFEGRVPQPTFPAAPEAPPPRPEPAPAPPRGAAPPRAEPPPASPIAAPASPIAPRATSTAPPDRSQGAAPSPANKGVLFGSIAAALILLGGAGAYLALGRSPAQARPVPLSSAAQPPSPVEPIESATLTGPGDVQPELVTGEAPRTPDPESAVSPTVVCRLLIGEDGAVKEASVFRSRLDLARFEEAAIAAVKAYKFRPGQRAGRAVPVWTNFPVSFR
jgi:protein TonB